MPLDGSNDVMQTSNWDQRQKHASFYQSLLNSVQQAACASFAASTLLPSVGAAMTKLSGLAEGQDKAVFGIALLAWVLLTAILAMSFGHTASRIETSYLEEYAALFPGSPPYRLESFLLDFAKKNPRLVRLVTN